MEKPTPHRKLPVVKALVETGKVRATSSARLGATALGLDLPGMLAVVMALTPADFFKSMTTQADHTVWQDVCERLSVSAQIWCREKIGHEICPV